MATFVVVDRAWAGGWIWRDAAEREPWRYWGIARIGYAAGVLNRNTTVPDSVGSTHPVSEGVSYLRELPIRHPALPRDR